MDVTGQSSETALVLTTLILATTFTPIKKRLEEIAGSYLAPQPATQPVSLPDTPIAAAANERAAGPVTIDADDLDRRIATIARRVSLEVLAESARAERSAQDHDPDQDEHERPDQVAQAREPRPQA